MNIQKHDLIMSVKNHENGIRATALGICFYLIRTNLDPSATTTLHAPYDSAFLTSFTYTADHLRANAATRKSKKILLGIAATLCTFASMFSLTSHSDIADTQTQTALDFAKEGKTIHTKVTVSRLPFGLSFDGFTVDMPVDSVVIRDKTSPDIYKVGIYVDGLKEKEIDKKPEGYTVPEFPSSLPKHSEQSEKNAL